MQRSDIYKAIVELAAQKAVLRVPGAEIVGPVREADLWFHVPARVAGEPCTLRLKRAVVEDFLDNNLLVKMLYEQLSLEKLKAEVNGSGGAPRDPNRR